MNSAIHNRFLKGWPFGLITAGAGVTVLVGWWLNIPSLKSVLPGFVTMKANTAVGFILAGVSLVLADGAANFMLGRRMSQGCAGVMALLGLLTLCQYLLGLDLGIDQLLFQEPAGAVGTLSPNRMAPTTAVSFFLLGGALWLVGFRRTLRIAQGLALLTGLMGLLPLMGYLYGAAMLIGVGHYTQMAVRTATIFILMSMGVLFLHPAEGLMATATSQTMGGWLVRSMVPFVIGIPIALGWFRLEGERHGYFEEEFGIAMAMVVLMVLLTGLIWWVARALNRTDGARRQAEHDLQASEARYRSLFEASVDGLLIADIETRTFKYANPALCRMLGYTEEELRRLGVADIHPKKDLPRVMAEFEAQMRGEKTLAADLPCLRKDGTLVFVDVNATMIILDNRPCLIGFFRDITERKRAEDELRSARAFLDNIINVIADPVFVKDAQRRFVLVNDALCTIVGRPRAGLLGQDGDDMFPQEQVAVFRQMDASVLDHGQENVNEECLSNLSTGEIRTIVTRKTRYIDPDGKRFLVGVIRDITERERAEDELHQSYDAQTVLNQLLRMSQENLPLDRILDQSLDLLLKVPWLSVNARGAVFIVEDDPKMLVLKAQRGLDPALLSACARVPLGRCLCGRSAATGQVIYADTLDPRHETQYDGILPHGHYCVPITIGKLTLGVLCLCVEAGHVRNVREENFVKVIADTLAGIIQRVRTQTDLDATQRKLVDASRNAGMAEIAANVLHNVGNALNSVNVSTGLVMDGVKTSKIANLARVVTLLQEHERDLGAFITTDPRGKQLPGYLAQLSEHFRADQAAILQEMVLLQGNINHIKEIAAMQQNYATVSGVKELADIRSLVEDSLNLNLGALNRHGVEIIREFDDLPPLNVDKNRILQILVNLVRNAKYACDESGRKDKRMTVRATHGDGQLRISVMDNGIGIPPENRARIFSHGFTTRKGGHGFGLHGGALAAKEMGGSLTVHSDGLGQGAVFTLTLPDEVLHE